MGPALRWFVTPSLRRRLRTTWTDVLIDRVGGGQGQDEDVQGDVYPGG